MTFGELDPGRPNNPKTQTLNPQPVNPSMADAIFGRDAFSFSMSPLTSSFGFSTTAVSASERVCLLPPSNSADAYPLPNAKTIATL